MNLYAYAGSNPVNYIDPTGHFFRPGPVILNDGDTTNNGAAVNAAADAAAAALAAADLDGQRMAAQFAAAQAAAGQTPAGQTQQPPQLDSTALLAAQTSQDRLKLLKPSFVWAEQQTGVPWEIQAAQWALETGWGVSTPTDVTTGQQSYNLFGVKGVGLAGFVWDYGSEQDDSGKDTGKQLMQWRAYHSYAESIADHAKVLSNDYWQPVHSLCGNDVKCWAHQLGPKSRGGLGYATDVGYEKKVLDVVDTIRSWVQ